MTAKEYLQRIRSERLEVVQLQETVDELIYSLLPVFRNWGLKLEAMENAARNPESSYQSETISENQK